MKNFLLSLAACSMFGLGNAATYSLVTSLDQIGQEATCLLVSGSSAMGARSANGNNFTAVEITVSNNTITPGTDVDVNPVTVTKVGDGSYTLKVKEGYLCSASSSSNYMKVEDTVSETSTAVITMGTNSTLTIKFGGDYTRNLLRYNSSSKLFSCYSTGQVDPQLYILGEGGNTGGETPGQPDQPSNPGGDDNGDEVTFDFVNNNYNMERGTDPYNANNEVIATEGGVTITNIKDEGVTGGTRLWSDGLRFYKGGKLKITATEEIKGVTFTPNSNNFTITSDAGVWYITTTIASGNTPLKTLTVWFTEPEGPTGPETPEGTITVAKCIELVNAGYEGSATVSGIVSQVDSYSSQYNSITYWISDDGTTANQMQVYSGKGIDGVNFTSKDDVAVGAKVVVTGDVKKYNNTVEFDKNNQLVSYTAPEGGDQPDQPEPPTGTITVAEALAILAGGQTNVTATVGGIISEITEVSAQYGNATYSIKDDLTDANALLVYRGKWIDGANFTSEDQIAVGGKIVVSGTLVNYNGTYEFTTGNKVVSYSAPEGDVPTPPTPDEPTGTSVTFDFTDPASLGIEVGDATEYDLTGTTLESGKVSILCEGEGVQNPIRLFCSSSGDWTFRFYKDTQFTVSVPEEYQLTGIVFDGTNLGSNSITYNPGSFSNNTWTPGANDVTSVMVTKTATGNNPTVKTMTVYYDKKTGVEAIEAVDGEAVYYNLQGVRVANPERGIFVKVQNGKAVKVVK